MTTPKPYVSKGSLADKSRRQVRSTGVNRIGKRTTVARQKPAARRRPKYQKSAALGALSGFFVVVCAATGSVFAAVGALTSASAGVGVAYLEYRRDLIEVKRTGKPIQDPGPVARRTVATDDLSDRAEPKPVDLDPPNMRRPPPARRPAVGDHASRCKAKPPGGPTCRCPDGPNRRGTRARRKT